MIQTQLQMFGYESKKPIKKRLKDFVFGYKEGEYYMIDITETLSISNRRLYRLYHRNKVPVKKHKKKNYYGKVEIFPYYAYKYATLKDLEDFSKGLERVNRKLLKKLMLQEVIEEI